MPERVRRGLWGLLILTLLAAGAYLSASVAG